MNVRVSVIALLAALLLAAPAFGQPAPAAAAVAARPAPDFSMPPVADAALDARIRALVLAIEDKPSGVFINNQGYIQAAPANQPYNADGSRNENFRVTPNLSGAEAVYALNGEARKQAAYDELVKIGRPAVPLLSMATVMEAYEQRPLYVKALGEIRDPRAVPFLMKYMEDGKMKVSMAPMVMQSGNSVESRKMEADGKKMMADSAAALQKVTGQNYGPVLGPWRQWWEENKGKVQGPMPPIQLYQVGTTGAPPGPMPVQRAEVQVSPTPGAAPGPGPK